MYDYVSLVLYCFFFQATDGIRAAQGCRGLGDVYNSQGNGCAFDRHQHYHAKPAHEVIDITREGKHEGFEGVYEIGYGLDRNYSGGLRVPQK